MVQLEAERERRVAAAAAQKALEAAQKAEEARRVAEAAQKAAEAAQRAAEREKAQKAAEAVPVMASKPTISPARRQQMESFIEQMRRTELQKLHRQMLDATEKSREMQTQLGWAVTGRENAKEALTKAEDWESVRKGELDEAAKNLKEIRDNSPFRAWLHDLKIWRSDLLAEAETAVNTAKQNHDHACYLKRNAEAALAKEMTPEAEEARKQAIKDQKAAEHGNVAEIEAMQQALHSPEWLDEAERQVNHMLDVREIVSAGQVEQSWGQTRFSHPPDLSVQEIERRDAVLAEQPEITKAVMEEVAKERDRGMDMMD
ncbi:hypothetical protein [Acidiphilium sp. JA12-A1]|uniref:hypothetical protein n=1 Tax=Acidiphilium sp. JA12-A1 TaxID=1464546 RepID=UPI000461E0F4|nr:hypothetical protein [Acidiphilium sp. JA12-A1]KDM65125.1 hypothetical protein ACIDI_191c00020 [Acidiphilium sp. JA12-A1]